MNEQQQADWNELMRQMSDQFQAMGRVFSAAMTEFWETPDGRYLKAVAQWAIDNPEQLDAMIAAREAEARTRFCDCLCKRWDHHGICAGTAVTEVPIRSEVTGRVQVPMCRPCADSVMAPTS